MRRYEEVAAGSTTFEEVAGGTRALVEIKGTQKAVRRGRRTHEQL